MKKVFLTSAIALSFSVFISCKETPKSQAAFTEPEVTRDQDSVIADMHNSANSIDIQGVYKGILPCADCKGIETEIAVNRDKTYVKRIKYLGKDDKIYGIKGTYTWNSAGNTITLSGIKDAPNQYFVGENTLTQLDMSGNRITGNLATNYVLKKQI
jgi:copper homeostasis protein (lipoprotein)